MKVEEAKEKYFLILEEIKQKLAEIHKNESLLQSIVIFGTSPYNTETSEATFRNLSRLFFKCQDLRRFGAAALDLCQVAAGRAGMFFEASLSLWDYAAAGIIVQEAGGVLMDMKGQSLQVSPEKTSVVAGTLRVIQESGIIRGE